MLFRSGAGAAAGTGFDPAEGVYTIMAAAPQTQFILHGQTLARNDPLFKLDNYVVPVPLTLMVDGVTKLLNQDYNAIKLSSSTLLIQYFATVNLESFSTSAICSSTSTRRPTLMSPSSNRPQPTKIFPST